MQDVCQAALQNIIGFIVQNATNSAYLILYRSGFTCRGFFYTVDVYYLCVLMNGLDQLLIGWGFKNEKV